MFDNPPTVFDVSSPPTVTRTPPATRDALDRRLLALLQTNARESTANLARKLGVARTTVLARIARLERDGVVVGYTARLGVDADTHALQAWVALAVSPRAGPGVVRALARLPEVRQLDAVSGEFDYVALVRAESPARLDALLDEVGHLDGVVRTTTSVLLARKVDRG